MTKIAIIGDTTQDLNLTLGQRFGIEVVSYYVQMGDQHFKDQVDIDSKKFYETMEHYDKLFTGVPPIQDVFDLLDRLKSEGYEQALMITSSAKMTGMYQLCGVIQSQYEGLTITIFDTGTIGATAGLFSIYAAELRDHGKTVAEIVDEMTRLRPQSQIFALFRTLSYLVKGGRFNKYKGMIGNFLNINPLLTEIDNEIGMKDKIRGTQKSLKRMIEEVKAYIGQAQRYRMVIFAGNNAEETQQLKEALAEQIEHADLFLVTEFTPVLGVHAGPKSIGVSIMILDEQ